jgi:hypothetical protein
MGFSAKRLHQEQGNNKIQTEVQLWLWKIKPWFAVTVGKSSLLLSVSKNSIYLMDYRMNLAVVRNVGRLGEETGRVAIISHDRRIL